MASPEASRALPIDMNKHMAAGSFMCFSRIDLPIHPALSHFEICID
jgi:hypothetical protein